MGSSTKILPVSLVIENALFRCHGLSQMKTFFQAEVAGRAADLDLVIAGFGHPAGFRRVVKGSVPRPN